MKTLVGDEAKEDNTDISTELTDKVKIEDQEYSLDDISMSALMDLSLDDLRDLDKKVGLHDQNY